MDPLILKIIEKACRGIRSIRLMCAELWPLLGKCSVAQTSTWRRSPGGAVHGQVSIPVLGFEWCISPPWLCICHLLLLLGIALPYKLPQWLQWVFWVQLCKPACSQRSYFYSLHYWRIWPAFPLCSYVFSCSARDVNRRTFPNVHLTVSACLSPAGQGVRVVCIDC